MKEQVDKEQIKKERKAHANFLSKIFNKNMIPKIFTKKSKPGLKKDMIPKISAKKLVSGLFNKYLIITFIILGGLIGAGAAFLAFGWPIVVKQRVESWFPENLGVTAQIETFHTDWRTRSIDMQGVTLHQDTSRESLAILSTVKLSYPKWTSLLEKELHFTEAQLDVVQIGITKMKGNEFGFDRLKPASDDMKIDNVTWSVDRIVFYDLSGASQRVKLIPLQLYNERLSDVQGLEDLTFRIKKRIIAAGELNKIERAEPSGSDTQDDGQAHGIKRFFHKVKLFFKKLFHRDDNNNEGDSENGNEYESEN